MSDTATLSQQEIRTLRASWSHHLQRRVMRLLSQLNHSLFHGQFRTFYAQSAQPKISLLQFYDRFLRLYLLSEELFGDILPRIQRQLSLQTNQLSMHEDPPTRGEIDWQRTLHTSINELPDTIPLRFHTTLRETSIATTENLFVVAVLHEYHQAVQSLLTDNLKTDILTEQEQQHLITIEDFLERELAIPHVRTLLATRRYLDTEQLAQQLTTQLRTGSNPYRDLLAWWEQFHTIHIGHTTGQRHLTFGAKRQDTESEQWLYQLWFVLELLQFLQEKQALLTDTLQFETDQIRFSFAWDKHTIRFTYNHPKGITFTRDDAHKIEHNGRLIWQEPALPLVCMYLTEELDAQRRYKQETIEKQLRGELQLTGSSHGLLVSANLAETQDLTTLIQELSIDTNHYLAHRSTLGLITTYQLAPDMSPVQIQQQLQALIQHVTNLCRAREPISCHGILLDADSINMNRDRLVMGNVLCPKPHIGPGVVDIVQRETHCLRDPQLCHVYGQKLMPPFVIRASTLDEVAQQTGDIREQTNTALSQAEDGGDEPRVEQLMATIFLGVGRTVERYVKMRGNTAHIEAHYEEWIFGEYWKTHRRALTPDTRNILISAAYVWDEYKHNSSLTDWAAPAIQYCRALETEIKRRLYDHYPYNQNQPSFQVPNNNMTLGAVNTICQNKGKDEQTRPPNERGKIRSSKANWLLCQNIADLSTCNSQHLDRALQRLSQEDIVKNRNLLAHGGAISQTIAQQLRQSIIGRCGTPGLLCWLAENLEPKV